MTPSSRGPSTWTTPTLQVHLLDAMGADALAVAKRLKLLQRASRNCSLACVHLLLKEGAPMNGTTAGGATALWLASKAGHAVVVRALLEAGADQHKFTGAVLSPLGEACRGGHAEVIRALLVRPNGSAYELLRDPSKFLSLACERGHAKALRLLLELLLEVLGKPKRHGLNVGGGWRVDDGPGRKLFCRAVQRGDLPCVQVLSSFGARGAPRRHPLLTFAAADGGGGGDNQHYDERSVHGEDRLARQRGGARLVACQTRRHAAAPPRGVQRDAHARAATRRRPRHRRACAPGEQWGVGARARRKCCGGAAGLRRRAARAAGGGAVEPNAPRTVASGTWRARAVELCRLGQLLAYTTTAPGPFTGEEESLKDAWVHFVVPRVLEREVSISKGGEHCTYLQHKEPLPMFRCLGLPGFP